MVARRLEDAAAIADLIERLGRLARAGGYADDLNPAQWQALRYLARCNRFSNTASALTQYLAATKGTISQTLNALERKGLIARKPDPASRRIVRLALTEAGQARVAADPLSRLTAAITRLGAARQATLADDLVAVLGALQRDHEFRPFGICGTCRHFRRDAPGGRPHFCSLLEDPLSKADSAALCVEHAA